jgi:hypothetical protein
VRAADALSLDQLASALVELFDLSSSAPVADDVEMSVDDELLASSPHQTLSDGEPVSSSDAPNPSKRRAHSEAP